MAYAKNKVDRRDKKSSLLQKLHPFSTTSVLQKICHYHKVIATQQVGYPVGQGMERYSFR